MYLLKRGKLIKEDLRFYGSLANKLENAKEIGDEQKIKSITERMESAKRTHDEQLARLPKAFNEDYDELCYQRDIRNVVDYYTKWTREDIYQSKASLSRIRKYEKREKLLPFDEILKEEKRKTDIAKLSEKGGR